MRIATLASVVVCFVASACERRLESLRFQQLLYDAKIERAVRLSVEGDDCFPKGAYYATLNGVPVPGGGTTETYELQQPTWPRETRCTGLRYSFGNLTPQWLSENGDTVFELRQDETSDPFVVAQIADAWSDYDLVWVTPADGRVTPGSLVELAYHPASLDPVVEASGALGISGPQTGGKIVATVLSDAKPGVGVIRLVFPYRTRVVSCVGVPQCSTGSWPSYQASVAFEIIAP